MARYQTGVSGNPKGRPKGTGRNQRLRQHEDHEQLRLARMRNALAELSRTPLVDSSAVIDAILDAYIEGLPPYEYPC